MTGYVAVYWRDQDWLTTEQAAWEQGGGMIPPLDAVHEMPVVQWSTEGNAMVCGLDGVLVLATSVYGFQYVTPGA